MTKIPQEPDITLPNNDWKHIDLYRRVKAALEGLAIHFSTETYIEGISATDIFTLNATLGATIEEQVVNTLNQMRAIWDPNGKYSLHSFVRQAQTFPDVLFKGKSDSEKPDEIVMGIELKGWYLLSKEAEPSFRYQVTPAACAAQDLLVVVPWALKNVISGHPRVFAPYVVPAKFAAELRNYHWRYKRQSSSNPSIDSPKNVSPYPSKSDQILDRPRADAGGNFGRYARTGIMDSYIAKAKQERLCGIPAEYWLHFFKTFVEQRNELEIREQIEKLRNKALELLDKTERNQFNIVINILNELESLLNV